MIKQIVIVFDSQSMKLTEDVKFENFEYYLKDISILERQIKFFHTNGYQEFLVLLNKNDEVICHQIANLAQVYGIKIDYFISESVIATGNLVLNAHALLQNEFVLIFASTILNTEINKLVESLDHPGIDFTLLYNPSLSPQTSELLEINPMQIVKKVIGVPKNSDYFRNHASTKCFAFKKYVFENFLNGNLNLTPLDFNRDLLPRIINEGFIAKGVRSVGYFYDCSKDDFRENFNDNWETFEDKDLRRPAIFIDRDGTLNKLNGFITDIDEIEVFEDVPLFVSEMKKRNYFVIVVTNQPVIEKGEVSTDLLDKFHAKIEKYALNKGGIIDDFFYCPHMPKNHDAVKNTNSFLDCRCRKPEIGLITQACDRYPIDLANSWMIGDSWRDAELAKRLKLNFIKIDPNISSTRDLFSITSLAQAIKIIPITIAAK